MIQEHATPSADAIEEAVDERIEYRLNGAALIDTETERTKFRIATN